jgi:hypothetical protein
MHMERHGQQAQPPLAGKDSDDRAAHQTRSTQASPAQPSCVRSGVCDAGMHA